MVRICTWNLENLYLPGDAAGPETGAAYQAKLSSLADVIATMAPDVLAVQEVGDEAALTDLAERVGGTWHQATAAPDRRGIRVGFLSRLPLTSVRQWTAFPPGLRPIQVDDTAVSSSTMGRAALQVRVNVAGRRIDLIACHLKSKLLTFPGGRFSTGDEGERARFGAYALHRRSAESVTVRAAATRRLAAVDGAAVVVLGDLNDEPQAATTQILLGPTGSEIGTGGFGRPDLGDRQRLWNLAARIPEEQRFSREYRGRKELIDHILVSHALVGRVGDGAVTTDGAGPTPSITDDPNARRGEPGSDHRPVLVHIDL
ncbi:endonuclease/exonuclease/phosphatase family protein [Cellulomonas sp. Root485]|uniref:endonuclease/exonuclease/phosphatase family protein n=1 Tax=Cellulomonas sp. Root485 TaxID=1736546 RepID=UPI000ABF42A6|nr:endonuclease/exonuclease/phosphatase family protein [Cellulomonas sp. Root485]